MEVPKILTEVSEDIRDNDIAVHTIIVLVSLEQNNHIYTKNLYWRKVFYNNIELLRKYDVAEITKGVLIGHKKNAVFLPGYIKKYYPTLYNIFY